MSRDWFAEVATPQQQQRPTGGRDWAGEAVGSTQPEPQKPDPAQSGNVLVRARNMIRGNQDPRFKDVSDFRDVDLGGVAGAKRMGAAVFGSDDAQLGDIYQKSLGDRFVKRFKDEGGHELIEHRGPEGNALLNYVNKPGLDMQDVARGVIGAIPYAIGGLATSAATKGAGMLARATGQAGAGAGTSLATDMGTVALGGRYNAGETMKKAVVTGALGAAAEVLPVRTMMAIGGAGAGAVAQMSPESTAGEYAMGAGIGGAAGYATAAIARRLMMNPGKYLDSSGNLTPAAQREAAQNGIDVNAMTDAAKQEWAKVYAQTRSGAQASVQADIAEMGIPVSMGQRTKDPQQLLREKNMRFGIYGDDAKEAMTRFDDQQQSALRGAVFGTQGGSGARAPASAGARPPTGPPTAPGVGQQINPESWNLPGAMDRGEAIRAGVASVKAVGDSAEKEAWKAVGPIQVDDVARSLMPQEIKAALSGRALPTISPESTPSAHAMIEVLEGFKNLARQGRQSEFLPSTAGTELNDVRKVLGELVGGANKPADRMAAGALYRAFNDWSETVSARGLVSDPAVMPAMAAARAVSRDWKGLFSPKVRGQETQVGAKLEKIMAADNAPELVVNEIIGHTTARAAPTPGRLETVKTLKEILTVRAAKSGDPALKEQGAQSWNEIRSAYWDRMTMDKNGQMKTPQMLINGLREARTNQQSIHHALFTETERAQMKRLEAALLRVNYKDPNPSGSASSLGAMVKQLGSTIASAVSASRAVQTVVGPALKPVLDRVNAGYGRALASRATTQKIKENPPSLGVLGAIGGHNLERSR